MFYYFVGKLITHYRVEKDECCLICIMPDFFSFLGVCTEGSRTSSENSEQGENTHLTVGESRAGLTIHFILLYLFFIVIGHNVAL